MVHPVNGEVPPVKGRPWKLPHYANRGKTSSSRGELASARSCFSTVRTALGKLRITGLLARFDVARSFPQFPRPLLLQPTIWTSERGADLGSGRCQPRPHLPIYRMTRIYLVEQGIFWGEQGKPVRGTGKTSCCTRCTGCAANRSIDPDNGVPVVVLSSCGAVGHHGISPT